MSSQPTPLRLIDVLKNLEHPPRLYLGRETVTNFSIIR